MVRARFISLEGGEGSGKSTQCRLLSEWLRGQGHEVVQTREPGGTPGAEEIRSLLVQGEAGRWEPMTEALLHFAARRDHVGKVIRPALARGAWVVSDRFFDSTLAYQGYGHGLGAAAIALLRKLVLDDFAPGLTLLFDLPVEAGLARAEKRRSAEARYESMGTAFHQRVRDGFHAIAAAEPARVAILDATREIAAVAEAACEAVRRHYPGAVR
ncbi:MAG: dTMP kinase [Rhodospirillaceae bacterium]|nr:dTMP kinase [Rhodospirillaceae bacterium]